VSLAIVRKGVRKGRVTLKTFVCVYICVCVCVFVCVDVCVFVCLSNSFLSERIVPFETAFEYNLFRNGRRIQNTAFAYNIPVETALGCRSDAGNALPAMPAIIYIETAIPFETALYVSKRQCRFKWDIVRERRLKRIFYANAGCVNVCACVRNGIRIQYICIYIYVYIYVYVYVYEYM